MRPEARRPFDGVRIVDLSDGIAGGYASKLLADAGADVVSIELRAGDPLRRRGASESSFDADGDGVLFRYLRTNQRVLALALESEAGRLALLRLYRECDAVLASQAVGSLAAKSLLEKSLDEWDLGERALAEHQPRGVLALDLEFRLAEPVDRSPGQRLHVAGHVWLDGFAGARGAPAAHVGG